MKMPHIYLFIFLFLTTAFNMELNDYHPRIWITPSDVPVIQNRIESGGVYESDWNNIISWCNSHINDGLSGLDYDEHLYRYAMAHAFTDGDTQYGNRVIEILTYLANNGSSYWNENTKWSGGDNNAWWYVPSALAVSYDWCFDMIDGHPNEATIETYLHNVLVRNATGVGQYDTWHKTEENWGWITMALAIANEQSSTRNSQVNSFLSTAEDFMVGASNDWSGSYVRSYNYITENGYPMYSDGYENDVANSMQYVAAWQTATTDNLMQWPYWTYKARAGLALMPPDGSYPKIGEVQPYGSGGNLSSSSYMGNTIWYMAGDYMNNVHSGYYDAVVDLNSSRLYDDWSDLVRIIWTTGTEDYTVQPRAYHFDKYGGFVFRSGWDFSNSTDIVGEIRGMKPYKNDHWVAHSGHIDLRRGSDYLLVSGGAYTGSYWNHPSSDDYNQDSDGQNTIHIDNIEHRSRIDGVNHNASQRADDEYGETKRFKFLDGDYVYGLYDMTKAFWPVDVNHTSNNVYRQLVFLDDQWIFVHDYVNKVTASDNVRTLWHMDGEPSDDGSGWTDSGQSPSTTGNVSTDGSVFTWQQGSSRTWIRVASSSSNVNLRKRGGSWGTSFVDIDGTNHTVSQYGYSHWGNWTVETVMDNPGTTSNILYTIQAKSSGAGETNVETINSTSYTGAVIRSSTRSAALFSTDGEDHNQANFSVSDISGTIKVVVANLEEGTYNVNGTGSYIVDSNGVLFFTANLSDSNSFVVSQGIPDTDPPAVPSNVIIK